MRLFAISFGPVLTPLLCCAHKLCDEWAGLLLLLLFSFPLFLWLFANTMCFILNLGDRVWLRCGVFQLCFLFFSRRFCLVRGRALLLLPFGLFPLVLLCLLHLNIVAHNLHVVYCQFYACSLRRGAQPRNLCVLQVFFSVLSFFFLVAFTPAAAAAVALFSVAELLVMYLLLHRSMTAVHFISYFVNTFCVTICTENRTENRAYGSQFPTLIVTTSYADLDLATTSSIYNTTPVVI